MRWFQPTPSAKVALWIIPIILFTVLYNNFRGETFLDLFNILQKLTPSTTRENLTFLFPEDRYPHEVITRKDGGEIQIIYQSPQQAIRLRKETGTLPKEVESCKEVPYHYAALIVSISSNGKVDGYSWDGEGPCWRDCCGRE